MDSIKKALHIGKHADHDTTTSSDAVPQQSVARPSNAGISEEAEGTTKELYTLPQEEKHSHGVLRQVLNPGGEKYDEEGYGATATTDARVPGVVDHNETTEHKPKEHGILRQIFNPGNDKYDPSNFKGSDDALAESVSDGQPIPGALATGSEARPLESMDRADDSHGVLRQLINPGGEKYDDMRHAPTATVATDSSAAPAASRE